MFSAREEAMDAASHEQERSREAFTRSTPCAPHSATRYRIVSQTKRSWLIAALFFCSGASGLIYQTVWMRILVRGFGVTVQATSTVVAVFLAGLALGALISPWWARRVAAGLRGYALTELVVGLSALAMTKVMESLPELMAMLARSAHLEDGPGQVLVRVVLSAAILLLPTTAMGITL